MDILEPIYNKLSDWIDYLSHYPNPNTSSWQERERYRQSHDLDCILLEGDLHADTIISLWIPLRGVLVRLNGYSKLKKTGK